MHTSPFAMIQFILNDLISTLLLIYPLHFVFKSKFFKLGMYLFILFQVYLIAKKSLSWLFFKYKLIDDGITIKRGIIKRNMLIVHKNQINQLIEDTPFLFKLFNVTRLKLTLETNSVDGNILFPSLTNSEANKIKKLISNEKLINNVKTKIKDIVGHRQIDSKDIEKLYHPEVKNVFISSISSLQIIAVYGYFETYQTYYKKFHLYNFIQINKMGYSTKGILICFFIFLLVILGFAKQYLNYGNFNLFADKKNIYTSTGFFSNKSSSITKSDIYTLVQSQSIIMQMFHLSKFDIYTLSPEQESENFSIKNPILPFINTNEGIDIVNKAFSFLNYIKMPLRQDMREILKIICIYNMLSIVFIIVILLEPTKIVFFAFLMIVATISIYEVYKYVFSNYIYSKETLNIRTGFFMKKQYLTTADNIEQIHISQSIYERLINRHSLLIYIRQQPVKKIRINMLTKSEVNEFILWESKYR